MKEDSEARALLTEAQLLVTGPDEAARWLQERGAAGQPARDAAFAERLERSLMARRSGRIDLALAEYSSCPPVVAELFARTRSAQADPLREKFRLGLRIACLANEAGGLSGGAPPAKAGAALTPEQLQQICVTGADAEVEALLANPTLPADVLVALYRNSPPFDALDDPRRARLVGWSAVNPRFERRLAAAGGNDPWQAAIQAVLPRLFAQAAVTPLWLDTLCGLLYRRRPDLLSAPAKAEFDQVLARWQAGATQVGDSLKGHLTDLPLVQEFRCLFAALYGRTAGPNGTLVLGSTGDADIARRCAYYGKGALKAEELAPLHARDGDVFVIALLMNDDALRNAAVRASLERDFLGPRTRYVYEARLTQIRSDDPAFDAADAVAPDPGADTVLEMAPSSAAMQVAAVVPRLTRLERRLDLLVIVLLVGLLALGAMMWRAGR